MNPATGQTPQQGQVQGQPGPPGQPARPPPMYHPQQIRGLPMLSEEEKNKYEFGLRGLWNKANNSPANSSDQLAARQKIMEFSKMLITKIHQRRGLAQQAQQQQQQPQQPQQQQQQQPQQPQQPPQQQPPQQSQQQGAHIPARPPSAQQIIAGQVTAQAQMQLQKQQQAAPGNANAAQGDKSSSSGIATGQAPNPQAAAVAAQRPKLPDSILQHASKLMFRPPVQMAEKSPAEIAKWTEEMRDRYARALYAMENNKGNVENMDKAIKDRSSAGRPLSDEDLRQLQGRRDKQLKTYMDAKKWVESVRRQHESINAQQTNQNEPGCPATAAQSSDATQATNTNAAQNKPQAPAAQVTAATPVDPGVEAAKNQQQVAAANRASPVTGTAAAPQPQARPTLNTTQPAVQQAQGQSQAQGPTHKQEQARPAPVNTGLASSMAQTLAQAQASATPGQGGVRVQTPQSSTPANTVAGPTRSLSHSAALSLANQRATGTPGSAPIQGQQPGVVTPSSAVAAMNPSIVQQQQQQGHPHAHPTQQQQQQQQAGGMTAKMPIPKQLPEKSTAVPQGVTLGGGVSAGRPTMSQGSGTLGGVMNQPPMARIAAYNHDAEGDHILSKKKLDELVRQVCGGAAEGQEGNMLSPEVEENILNMADSFVDNVLHAACRNSKERGSKVLEIRDIQLVLERTYNIRVPGYSSDELRTVRKVLPSAGWIAKMSAVQAAKVMPGKGDT
ncbi:Histone-fold protein [Ophiocordyceps sinensis CO18]|uniref:Histone-fold protein n=1 Tax=Ophiocordyceps sinensis (strain Co18 / CGMCC 3.14243) TaxID=911162 RepID=T5A2D2_OPHSC|nr:Histone-fold protein [Ophiocordyceps sinensis CO18]